MFLLTETILVDVLVFFITLIFGFYFYFTQSFDYWKKRNVPYLKPNAFVGNFLEVIKQKRQIGIHLAHLYKQRSSKYLGIWVFNKPQLIINDPDLIRNILIKDFFAFGDRTFTSDSSADPIISKTLFAEKNPTWKMVRAKVTPIFTSAKIKGMVSLITQAADQLHAYLNNQLEKSNSVEAKEVCAKYTTQIISSCAFGLEASCYDDENAPFLVVGRKMFEFSFRNALRVLCYFFAPFMVKTLKIAFFDPSATNFCRDVFSRTIKTREESKIMRNDFVDLLIELKNAENFDGLDFESNIIVAQATQFFVAGYETTSSTMAFLLYEMALNPGIQNKLRVEIEKVLKKHEGRINNESIKDMNYLDQVLKETLRMYPILPFLDRMCLEDYQLDNDLVIEKGTPVYIPAYGLHHDEKYFPNPGMFDPERFSAENITRIVPFSYLPFGQGPRNCIGERFAYISSKIGIVQILANFLIEPNEKTPKSISFDPRGLVLQSEIGLPLRFLPIKRNIV